MTLFKRIVNYMKLHTKEVSLEDIYERFNNIKKSTIRGRINEKVGSKLIRVGRGKYLLIEEDVEAIVEQIDSRIAIPNILASLLYYDMIFLDIPYSTAGQKSGNRNILDYDLVMPEEFEKMIVELQKTLRTEKSQLYFMIAGGKSSKRDAAKYLSSFSSTKLELAAKGTYTKLTSSGRVCNMGKYPLPPEDIFIYSHNGKLAKPDETQLDFSLQRPPLRTSYPTEKPTRLLEKIIEQSTNIGDTILDMFGGSGSTLKSSLKLKRKCHIMDTADNAIARMKKILNQHQKLLSLRDTSDYDIKELQTFSNGCLF